MMKRAAESSWNEVRTSAFWGLTSATSAVCAE